MEKYATTKIFERVLKYQMFFLLERIADYKKLSEEEKKDFIEEYQDPIYYNLEWVRKESLEYEQLFDAKGRSLFKI
jgi:hypothetical protein